MKEDFEFYMTSKLTKPDFSPMVFIQLCIIDFTITEEALTDQIVNRIISHEASSKYTRIQTNI